MVTMRDTFVRDSFSSDHLMPNQPGIWWIKYNKDIHFDKIVINFNDEFDYVQLKESQI